MRSPNKNDNPNAFSPRMGDVTFHPVDIPKRAPSEMSAYTINNKRGSLAGQFSNKKPLETPSKSQRKTSQFSPMHTIDDSSLLNQLNGSYASDLKH